MVPRPTAFRFLTWNIRYDNPRDGEDGWPRRRAGVAALVARARPDVVGLQEAMRHQLDELVALLEGAHGLRYDWVGAGRDDGREGGELNPVLWRADLLRRSNGGTFWLSDTPEAPGSRLEGATLPRIVTWAGLERVDGSAGRFYVFNTHLEYASAEVRARSASILLERVPGIAGLRPSVLVGDLNDVPGSEPHRRLCATFFADARAAAAALPPDRAPNAQAGTWTDFRDPATAGLALPGDAIIDHVFTSGFAVDRFETSLAVRDDGGRCLSDHRPVLVDARLIV